MSEQRKQELVAMFPGRKIVGMMTRNKFDVVVLQVTSGIRAALNSDISVWVPRKS